MYQSPPWKLPQYQAPVTLNELILKVNYDTTTGYKWFESKLEGSMLKF